MSEDNRKIRPLSFRIRSAFVIGVTVLLMTALIGVGAVGAGLAAETETDEPITQAETWEAEDEWGETDEVYLEEDGSGVLVYEDENEVDELLMGMDASTGLAHMLIIDDFDETDDDFEGSMSALLEDNLFSVDGQFYVDQPAEIAELDVDMSGEQSEAQSTFDAEMYALLDDGAQQPAFESITTNGDVEVTGDSFTATGDFDMNFGMDFGEADDEHEPASSFALTETDTGYLIEASEREMLFGFNVEAWETEEAAQQTLEQEYGALATELGGDVTIEIDHHEFEETDDGSYWHEIDYTIEYENIDDGAQQLIADDLVDDPSMDITEDEAAEIAESILAVEIEIIEYTIAESGGDMSADWNVVINDYSDMAIGIIEADDTLSDDEIDEFTHTIEAQEAADTTTTLSWNAEAGYTADNLVELEATVDSDTENWDAYVAELEDRGVSIADEELTYEMTAETVDGEIHMGGEFVITADDLVQDTMATLTAGAEEDADEVGDFVSALEDAELEIAKMDLNAEDRTLEVEAGAKFDDASAFATGESFLGGEYTISQFVAQDEEESAASYVYVEDLTDDGVLSDEEIDDLGVIGDDTEVFEPGEGDRELPEMDTEQASAYLGIDEPDPETEDAADDAADADDIPGFGLSVTAVAIAALMAALLARRR